MVRRARRARGATPNVSGTGSLDSKVRTAALLGGGLALLTFGLGSGIRASTSAGGIDLPYGLGKIGAPNFTTVDMVWSIPVYAVAAGYQAREMARRAYSGATLAKVAIVGGAVDLLNNFGWFCMKASEDAGYGSGSLGRDTLIAPLVLTVATALAAKVAYNNFGLGRRRP